MHCEDHVTYVTRYAYKEAFLAHWHRQGLKLTPPIITQEFPAEHIAMVEQPGETQSCELMIGLSVSQDPESPINKLCDLVSDHVWSQGVLQHIAYSIDPSARMDQVRAELVGQGVTFMTPIFEYKEPSGAALRQMFVACLVPFGPFIEIVQRTAGTDGIPFQGFNGSQIDNLYRAYKAYSLELERRA